MAWVKKAIFVGRGEEGMWEDIQPYLTGEWEGREKYNLR